MDGSDRLIAAYLAHLRALNRRPTSIAHREWALRYLLRFSCPVELLDLDFDVLRMFVDRPTLGAEARNSAISHVRGFYRWAVAHEHLEHDPSARLERPRRPRRLPRPMPLDAIILALNEAPDPIRQWLFLAAYAGLRACEVAQLSCHDFLLDQRPPVLIVEESKGGNTDFIPIAIELLPVAMELAAGRGWCFPRGAGDPSGRRWVGHISANQLQRRANRFLHEVGVPQTFHQLRHWFGTELHRASGGDLRVTQEGLRHRSPTSTAIYTFVAPRDIARALDALPRLTA